MANHSLAVMPKALQGVPAPGQYNFEQLLQFADICHASGLFEDVTGAAQAFAKIAKGQEMGLPPMTAMSGIDIIRKRLFLKPWIIAAKINTCGYGSYRVTLQTAEQCTILFRKKYAGEGWVTLPEVTYTYAEAKAQGIIDNSKHWKGSPAHMLYQRCMGRGGAMHFPELLAGLPVPQDDEPLPDDRLAQNIAHLFGEEQDRDATAFPPRATPRTVTPTPRAGSADALSYSAQIEAAILAQHGTIEPWYIWAERKYGTERGAFTVADWEDFLGAVRTAAQRRSPSGGGVTAAEGIVSLAHETLPAAAAPFVDPETGEVLTPGPSEEPSWGGADPDAPNLFLEEEKKGDS